MASSSKGIETHEVSKNDQIPKWVSELSEKQKAAIENVSSPCYIYKVPSKLRVAVDKFEPRVVSIGPYHITKQNMDVTENIKEMFVLTLIRRTTTRHTSTIQNPVLINMWREMSNLQADFRECYTAKVNLEDEAFVKMLVFDGCFILELLYRYQLCLDHNIDVNTIFQNNWLIPCLQQDLVLLENQIPFSVLTKLFELAPKATKPGGTDAAAPQTYSLEELILCFFDPILPTDDNRHRGSSTTHKHLLDLVRTHLIHQDGIQAQLGFGKSPHWQHTTCATDLQNAGVTFKSKETQNGILDITFSHETLEIPPFHFGISWATLFLNMIALEQCRQDYPDKITSYAILMDNLINTSHDVKLLREKNIILSSKEEDETIADTVNRLCKEVIYEKFYYDDVCGRLNTHRRKTAKRWRAAFYQNYIHTPWAGVSLIAALILLVMAFVQTVFTILSWKLAYDQGLKK